VIAVLDKLDVDADPVVYREAPKNATDDVCPLDGEGRAFACGLEIMRSKRLLRKQSRLGANVALVDQPRGHW
jgi:hypothetical protein